MTGHLLRGALGGSGRPTMSAKQAEASLTELRSGSPRLSFGGIAAPFAGLFNSGGSALALIAPDAPSIAQDFRLLPANLKPPVEATNAGLYGYALDTATSPAPLAAAQAHLGRLAADGEPRGWSGAGELPPLRRLADMFSGWGLKGLDGTAWYHPLRLTIDAGAVAAGTRNPAQRTLGLRAVHGRDLPKGVRIYAFAASLGADRVLDAAHTLARQSGIPRRRVTLVDRSATYAHNDPNSAAPRRNTFLKGLESFLEGVASRAQE